MKTLFSNTVPTIFCGTFSINSFMALSKGFIVALVRNRNDSKFHEIYYKSTDGVSMVWGFLSEYKSEITVECEVGDFLCLYNILDEINNLKEYRNRMIWSYTEDSVFTQEKFDSKMRSSQSLRETSKHFSNMTKSILATRK